MYRILAAVILPLALGGCFSFHENPPPPKNTTIVVPPGSSVTCSPGATAPC